MSMKALCPYYRFSPLFKEKLWGGQKLRSWYPSLVSVSDYGEAWLLYDMGEGEVSKVHGGIWDGWGLDSLLLAHKEAVLGKKGLAAYDLAGRFPWLVKLIDARANLSIQVHPGDALARRRHGSLGKTEMWYILEASPGAEVAHGFKQRMEKAQYISSLRTGDLSSYLHYCKVSAGDVFFIPSGRVHSIGGGIFFAEIQQSSDITYRIDDFGRLDADGNPRSLHQAESVSAVRFDEPLSQESVSYERGGRNKSVPLIECPYFSVNKLHCTDRIHRDLMAYHSCVLYLVLSGQARWYPQTGAPSPWLRRGDCMLIPAVHAKGDMMGKPEAVLLECFLP